MPEREQRPARRIIVVFAVMAAMAFPAAAHAGYSRVDDRGWLDHAVERWDAVVGYRPCHGNIEVASHRFTSSARAHAHRDCRVHLNADKRRRLRAEGPDAMCLIFAHEIGHLAQRDHTGNRRSIMYPSLPDRHRWCPDGV